MLSASLVDLLSLAYSIPFFEHATVYHSQWLFTHCHDHLYMFPGAHAPLEVSYGLAIIFNLGVLKDQKEFIITCKRKDIAGRGNRVYESTEVCKHVICWGNPSCITRVWHLNHPKWSSQYEQGSKYNSLPYRVMDTLIYHLHSAGHGVQL